MYVALLLAIQVLNPEPLDLDLRPPRSEEVGAAELRAERQVPRIVQLCREAIRSGDVKYFTKTFADQHGLSSYGRVNLSTYCAIYRQGLRDRASK
jgi:hypothetical protein